MHHKTPILQCIVYMYVSEMEHPQMIVYNGKWCTDEGDQDHGP